MEWGGACGGTTGGFLLKTTYNIIFINGYPSCLFEK